MICNGNGPSRKYGFYLIFGQKFTWRALWKELLQCAVFESICKAPFNIPKFWTLYYNFLKKDNMYIRGGKKAKWKFIKEVYLKIYNILWKRYSRHLCIYYQVIILNASYITVDYIPVEFLVKWFAKTKISYNINSPTIYFVTYVKIIRY